MIKRILIIFMCLVISSSVYADYEEEGSEYDTAGTENAEAEDAEAEDLPPAILNVRIKQYNVEQAVRSLFDDADDILADIGDPYHFSVDLEDAVFSYNGRFTFAAANSMPYTSQINLSPWVYWSRQDNYLDAVFPNDPEEMACYGEALEMVSSFADDIGFSAAKIRSYKIDGTLAKIVWEGFETPAPGKSKEDAVPYEWDESNDAIFFVIEPDSISGCEYASLAGDGLLNIIWTQKDGIIYVNAPYMYELVSREETEVVDSEAAKEGIQERAAMIYLVQYDLLEIEKEELVYTYKPGSIDETAGTAELVPCWKFSYRSNDPDKNVYFPIYEQVISKVSDREGYILIDAISGDPSELDINQMLNSL